MLQKLWFSTKSGFFSLQNFLQAPSFQKTCLFLVICLRDIKIQRQSPALRFFNKCLIPIKPIAVKNYNFGSSLKIGLFLLNMAIWFIDYNGKRITDKKMQFTGIEKWDTQKMRPMGDYLVDFSDFIKKHVSYIVLKCARVPRDLLIYWKLNE